jgi:FMN phosphatase YigB (HAD superfamily)
MIKAVIFDLDNTLTDFMKMKRISVEAAVDAMIDAGLSIPKKKALDDLYNIYWKEGIEDPKIFQKFLKKATGKIDYNKLAYAIVAYRKARTAFLHSYPGTKRTLIDLKKKGLRLAIVSDAPKLKAWIRLVNMGIDDFFDVVGKEDTGRLKPSRLPFRAALKELKLKDSFKKTEFYKTGKIYLNDYVKKDYSKIKSFKDLGFDNKNEVFEIYSGKGDVSLAFRDAKYDNSKIMKTIKTVSLKEMEPHIIKTAISKIDFFNFDNLSKSFPTSLNSINDLIIKKEFLADISIDFKGTREDLDNITNKQKLEAVINVLNKIKNVVGKNITAYNGSEFTIQEKISEIFKEIKQIKLPKKDRERCEGMEEFLKDKDWYVYNANYGTDQERYCVEFIDKLVESDKIKGVYEEAYLIRNELFFKIYDFNDGQAFAPDFLFILKNKKGEKLTYQIFLEPKGKHLEKADEWKEKFLHEIKDRFSSYGLKKFVETTNYRLIGVSFYNKERENEIENEILESIK